MNNIPFKSQELVLCSLVHYHIDYNRIWKVSNMDIAKQIVDQWIRKMVTEHPDWFDKDRDEKKNIKSLYHFRCIFIFRY